MRTWTGPRADIRRTWDVLALVSVWLSVIRVFPSTLSLGLKRSFDVVQI